MEITVVAKQESTGKQVTITGVPSEGVLPATPAKNLVEMAIADGEFSGKIGEIFMLHMGNEDSLRRILTVGLGETGKITPATIRKSIAKVVAYCRERKLVRLAVDVESFAGDLDMKQVVRALAEGALLADYQFDRYQAEKGNPRIEKLSLKVKEIDCKEFTQVAIEAEAVAAGVYLCRDLVNEPGNTKSPQFLADEASRMATDCGIECEVLCQKELMDGGFGGLLGVAQGSEREPKLIVLTYKGVGSSEKPVALVGKGVVFDSGGISLKPGEKMDEMKMDMAGGAAVIGTMMAIAKARLPVHVVAVVPAVENMPSGTAYRPGDILTTLSGKTIEVLNTDAEGRLILADALTYVAKFEPTEVIDLATLTGAVIMALGNHASAVLGNDQDLIDGLRAAGEQSNERLWQLPLWDEYAEQLKSTVADLKNIGGRPAGTITAAAFLGKFADEYKWAHIDIAGTAWEDKGGPECPRGGTGVGVRLLFDYLQGK